MIQKSENHFCVYFSSIIPLFVVSRLEIRDFRHLISAQTLFPNDLFSNLNPARTWLAYRWSPVDFWIGAHRRWQKSRDRMRIDFLSVLETQNIRLKYFLHRSLRIPKVNRKSQTIFFASFPQEHGSKTEDWSGLIRLCMNQFPPIFLTGYI